MRELNSRTDTGKTVRLDDATETTYVDAQGLEHPGVPDQPADYRSEIGESELDYEDLTRKNTERMVNNALPPTQTPTPGDESETDTPEQLTGIIAENSAVGGEKSADKSLDVE